MQVARVAPDWPVPSLMHRRRVVGDRITYVGLDVHKEGIVVAVAEGGLRGEVREYGRIADPTLVARPRQLHDASTVMRFQPAHQSMINRRHDGRASCLARQSLQEMLETKPRIYLPATCKGGHESGANDTLDTRFGGWLATPLQPFAYVDGDDR